MRHKEENQTGSSGYSHLTVNAAVWGGWIPVKLAVIFRGTEDLNHSLRDQKKSGIKSCYNYNVGALLHR